MKTNKAKQSMGPQTKIRSEESLQDRNKSESKKPVEKERSIGNELRPEKPTSFQSKESKAIKENEAKQ